MLSTTRILLGKHCERVSILNKHQFRRVGGFEGGIEKLSDLNKILATPLVDTVDNNIFDITAPWRTEEIHTVESAKSINNLFSNISIPQNPWMASNNWNSPHQDSYCSESVGLDGPDSNKLKLVKQYNPYGFVPTMVCNQHDQLIGVSFKNGIFRLITFDNDCNILTSNIVNTYEKNTFGGGYFYLNQYNDTIVIEDKDKLACYNTSDLIEKKDYIYELKQKWKSKSLVELLGPAYADKINGIYSTLPVWNDTEGNKYWVLMPGEFNYKNNDTKINPVEKSAFIAVMEIDENGDSKIDPHNVFPLSDQYVNNTLSADESGVYLVTNAVTKDNDDVYKCNDGYLVKLAWNNDTKRIDQNGSFMSKYNNAGYRKKGMANIGSGTTPTIFKSPDDQSTNYVVIGDNDSPRMNICIYHGKHGHLVSKTPVFNKMRSCDEASFIGVNGRIVAENNFGHGLKKFFKSQYIANEPGMTMINFDGDNSDGGDDNIIWDKQDTCFFAMSMLCRESGIIYAYTVDWFDNESATKGGMFYISAIDSFDGRTVWKIPIGRGHPYQHSVGGIYFDRIKKRLFVGSYDFLISIQNFDEQKFLESF